ncbi:hypothetical protein Tco_0955829 [Tanacetum coccineum]|uniref:F-box associated domain-containing protein n=1 Tax=Tanacetum coccineum TaxID=301880 RepID=A0ABQ5E897_9ASTR
MLVLIDIPGILHMEGRLFDSRGCLLLVCRDDIGSREFTIYMMMKECSVWTVRYLVNTDKSLTPLPEQWSIRSTVWSISLGEREEGHFLVIKLSRKVVKYNLILKTISQIFDIGSNQMNDDDYEFFPPYTVSHNPYEFCIDRSLFESDFVLLDSRLNSIKSTMDNSFGSAEEVDHVRILQSCNGLLLCAGWACPIFYYVHNPSTNLFKRLPQSHYSHGYSHFYRSVILRMALDPRKSFDYKVVQAGRTSCDIKIQNYSLEMGY